MMYQTSHPAAIMRPRGEGRKFARWSNKISAVIMMTTAAVALLLIMNVGQRGGSSSRFWSLIDHSGDYPILDSEPTPLHPLLGFSCWPFGRNSTSNRWRKDLKWITKKLMDASFRNTDKNRSGYLELEDVIPMMHVFYFVSKLDLIDYLVEDLPESQMNATATALAQEYFGNVTTETYQEEARAFILKLDQDKDGKLSRRDIDTAFQELYQEFDKAAMSPEQFITLLSYFIGSLYRLGMLNGEALATTNLLNIVDTTKEPKEAIAAVLAYIKTLRKLERESYQKSKKKVIRKKKKDKK